jgi:beta-glucanase (GH16 family)
MTVHRWRYAAVAAGAVVAAGALASLPGSAGAAVPSRPGWNLVWADDFNGAAGSGVNQTSWQYTTGTSYPGGPANFGTGEVEMMTSSTSNVSLDGSGNLRITAQRDGAGNWTSGRIETRRSDFQPPAGGKLRVEARLQMPDVTGAGARGYWPAFWMLGAPYRGNWWNWPGVGELDIMENVQGINNEWATMHCGTSPGGPCNEKSGIGGQRACSGTTCQGGFHTYALEWDRSTNPQQMRWYLDGVQFHSVSQAQVPANVWTDATNHGFFIILNVAMGGEFPAAFGGGPDGATIPGRPMVVDYVAVWQSGTSSPPPTSPPRQVRRPQVRRPQVRRPQVRRLRVRPLRVRRPVGGTPTRRSRPNRSTSKAALPWRPAPTREADRTSAGSPTVIGRSTKASISAPPRRRSSRGGRPVVRRAA